MVQENCIDCQHLNTLSEKPLITIDSSLPFIVGSLLKAFDSK